MDPKPPSSTMAAAASSKFPNYVMDRETFYRFLHEYVDPAEQLGAKYMRMCRRIALRETRLFVLALDDLAAFGQLYLAQRITMNVSGYVDEISRVVDDSLPPSPVVDDAIDQLLLDARAAGQALPPLLTRRYEVVVLPLAQEAQPLPLRSLKGSMIGTLTTIRGVCISATAVRPKLMMLTSVCEVCAEATFQQVVGDRVTPQLVCKSQRCQLKNSIGRLLPQYKASRFTKFQELRVQEQPQDVPKGAIPRTMRVICEGEQARIATPGQSVRIVGTYCPDPGTGQGNEALKASTMVRTQYRAILVELEKRSYHEAANLLRDRVEEARNAAKDRDALIEKLVRSIAPEIWGFEDVKKALLCLMVGGSQMSAEGIRIRSDINICFMGDPGVAKSQLLKWVAATAPRSVFTTGKGSSGVGLTAAVVRDSHTGDTVLEGGALVLSDHGVCCIDEFDKMEESDRTSLHEVMEQQSVSIAKAGIITTLNARTSILAASNPKYGRWKRNATPSENVNLPPALLSRFDLLWLLLDEADRERDAELSMHVTHVHLHGIAPGLIEEDSGPAGGGGEGHPANAAGPAFSDDPSSYFSKDFLRAFVGEVKRIHPVLDQAASKAITDVYCEMRSRSERQTNVVTARTLLSLVRLSQALARIRFSERVTDGDVREASRLLDASKASLQEKADRPGGGRGITLTDAGIYSLIKDISRGRPTVQLVDIRPALIVKGISEAHLQRCLKTYTEVGVWELEGSTLHFAAA